MKKIAIAMLLGIAAVGCGGISDRIEAVGSVDLDCGAYVLRRMPVLHVAETYMLTDDPRGIPEGVGLVSAADICEAPSRCRTAAPGEELVLVAPVDVGGDYTWGAGLEADGFVCEGAGTYGVIK